MSRFERFLLDNPVGEEKSAGWAGFAKKTTKSLGAGLVQGMGAMAATGVGAAAIYGGKKVYDALTKSRDFNAMLKANPDLHEAHTNNPEQFNQFYNSLRSNNQAYAKDPTIAGGYMRQMVSSPEAAWSILTGNKSPVDARDKYKSEASEAMTQGFHSGMVETLKNKMQSTNMKKQQKFQLGLQTMQDKTRNMSEGLARKHDFDKLDYQQHQRDMNQYKNLMDDYHNNYMQGPIPPSLQTAPLPPEKPVFKPRIP